MNTFKKILLFSISIAILFADQKDTLTIGTASGYSPYVSLNKEGAYEGFDIDVATALAQKLGRKLVVKDLGSMPALFIALKQKKVDLLIWAISITKERQKACDFVYYQGEKAKNIAFLFWTQAPDRMDDFLNNPQNKIGVEAGSCQQTALNTLNITHLKSVEKITDALLELKMKKIQALVCDDSLVPIFKKKYPNLCQVLYPLPQELQSEGHGICISKDNTNLKELIETTINELKASGQLEALEKKWNLSKKEAS